MPTPLNIALLTISDTRTSENDDSGNILAKLICSAGHKLTARKLIQDNIYQIRATLSPWIADSSIHCIITTGGTGFSHRDSTPEAIIPLLDKTIEGFGEIFRAVSLEQIGASTVQSRAFAGIANTSCIFCLPGSPNACKTAWKEILQDQLNSETKPCNFVGLLTSKR